MENPPQGMHLCPTRVDLEDTLFAHLITKDICQQRQRQHYHKCPTCQHMHDRVAAAKGLPKKEAV
jgi:hypothetical protein